MSMSERHSFREGIQLLQKDSWTRTCSIFGFDPLHNYHLGISMILKESDFTYLGSDDIDSHLEKAILGRWPFARM